MVPIKKCNKISLGLQKQKQKVMYNIHTYNSQVRMQQQNRDSQQRYAKYLLKHEDYKDRASHKIKERVQAFVNEQSDSPKPFVFEDDHFISWRKNKQYRDVEDRNKFLSFKTFRHKPNQQMDKYFNSRQRKQFRELSSRKQHLVRSNIIPDEQRGRSLRCQGPLSPKIQFREKRKDHEYLQPRLRFANVTDRQRMNQSAMSFDDKFKSLYNSFEMTKSKIGRTTVSPNRQRCLKGSQAPRKDTLDFIDQAQSELGKSKPFYFQKDPQQQSLVPPLNSKNLNPQSCQLSRQNSKTDSPSSKTYFKLAKTMHLFSDKPQERQRLDRLMKRTQYDREKHLNNIRYNVHGENYVKNPIL